MESRWEANWQLPNGNVFTKGTIITPSDMTTAEEFFRAKLRALKPNEERITLQLHKIDCETAMRWGHEWAKQYLSEHSTKEQEVVAYMATSKNLTVNNYYDAYYLTEERKQYMIETGFTITPLVKKTV